MALTRGHLWTETNRSQIKNLRVNSSVIYFVADSEAVSSSTQTSYEISKSDSFTGQILAYNSECLQLKPRVWEKIEAKQTSESRGEASTKREESKNFLPRTIFQTDSGDVGHVCHHLYYQSLCCPGSDGKRRGPSASFGWVHAPSALHGTLLLSASYKTSLWSVNAPFLQWIQVSNQE